MRDNDNQSGWSGGAGQIKPVFFVRTEYQVSAFEGFKPEEIHPRDGQSPSSASARTPRLAEPPAWAQRDGLPCVQLVPKGHARDPYDTSDRKQARALCAGCPVRRACLDDAMEMEHGLGGRSRYLVRGGLTPHARARLDARSGDTP